MWSAATDLPVAQQAPAVALRLGGLAREISRELPQQQLINGTIADYNDGLGYIQRTGLEVLMRGLANRFAPLEVELVLKSISNLLQL